MGNWRAIVFDLDDTLYPERAFVRSGFRAVASWMAERLHIPARHGYAELSALFAAGVRGDTFDRWLRSHGLPVTLVPELVAVYQGHTPRVRPFRGIPALLAALRADRRLGLISDGHLAVQRRKLDALALAEHFDAIVFSDQWGRRYWKPNPRPFIAARELLGCGTAPIVYVADNPTKDFIGAREAGFGTIWARHSAGDYARLTPRSSAHAADLTVDTVPQLAAVLVGAQRAGRHGAATRAIGRGGIADAEAAAG